MGISCHQVSILTQDILCSSVIYSVKKILHGNSMESTLLFSSLHAIDKRKSILILTFFSFCMTGKMCVTFVPFNQMQVVS